MNTILAEATDLAKAISSGVNPEKSTVIFFPPFPFLQNVREVIANASNFSIGAAGFEDGFDLFGEGG